MTLVLHKLLAVSLVLEVATVLFMTANGAEEEECLSLSWSIEITTVFASMKDMTDRAEGFVAAVDVACMP